MGSQTVGSDGGGNARIMGGEDQSEERRPRARNSPASGSCRAPAKYSTPRSGTPVATAATCARASLPVAPTNASPQTSSQNLRSRPNTVSCANSAGSL